VPFLDALKDFVVAEKLEGRGVAVKCLPLQGCEASKFLRHCVICRDLQWALQVGAKDNEESIAGSQFDHVVLEGMSSRAYSVFQ
jgi:hypothetical protein